MQLGLHKHLLLVHCMLYKIVTPEFYVVSVKKNQYLTFMTKHVNSLAACSKLLG